MIIYVNDYDVGIEALPTPTITLLLLLVTIGGQPLLVMGSTVIQFVQ